MFRAIADLEVAGQVYAEGWQSWSPVRIHRAGEVSERAPDERAQKTEWRPDKPVARFLTASAIRAQPFSIS